MMCNKCGLREATVFEKYGGWCEDCLFRWRPTQATGDQLAKAWKTFKQDNFDSKYIKPLNKNA